MEQLVIVKTNWIQACRVSLVFSEQQTWQALQTVPKNKNAENTRKLSNISIHFCVLFPFRPAAIRLEKKAMFNSLLWEKHESWGIV